MKPDDFEKRLQSQPLRQIPTEWRTQILEGARNSAPSALDPMARRSQAKAARPSVLSTINHLLSTLLWPNPKAWIGLAAVWVVIFALQFSSRGHSPKAAMASASQPSVFLTALKDRQQTLVELMGNNQPKDAEPPRRATTQPRSELCGQVSRG